jgi:hypothetical protein
MMAQGWWEAIDPPSERGVPESSASAKRQLLCVLLAGDAEAWSSMGERSIHKALNGRQVHEYKNDLSRASASC